MMDRHKTFSIKEYWEQFQIGLVGTCDEKLIEMFREIFYLSSCTMFLKIKSIIFEKNITSDEFEIIMKKMEDEVMEFGSELKESISKRKKH